jgi:hypothetical protein
MGNEIKVTRLTWPEINRILTIFNNSPCHSLEGDAEIIQNTGLIEWYDDDPEYVSAAPGGEEAFLEFVPQPRVRNEWRCEKVLPCEKEAISPLTYESDSDTERERNEAEGNFDVPAV